MADQPKKKNPNAVVKSADRANGKRVKSNPTDTFGHNKAYRGSHTRRSPQSPLQRVLLGQGAFRNIAHRVDGTSPKGWSLPSGFAVPYDAVQAALNKRLYPHLFTD